MAQATVAAEAIAVAVTIGSARRPRPAGINAPHQPGPSRDGPGSGLPSPASFAMAASVAATDPASDGLAPPAVGMPGGATGRTVPARVGAGGRGCGSFEGRTAAGAGFAERSGAATGRAAPSARPARS